jgi:hypothetical protein
VLKVLWRIRDLPELGHLTFEERRRLIRSTIPRDQIMWMWARCAGLGVVAGFMVAGLIDHFSALSSFGIAISCVFGGIITIALFQVYMLIIRNQVRLTLRRGLKPSELPVCLRCGYVIRGQVDAGCPECGWGRADEEVNG